MRERGKCEQEAQSRSDPANAEKGQSSELSEEALKVLAHPERDLLNPESEIGVSLDRFRASVPKAHFTPSWIMRGASSAMPSILPLIPPMLRRTSIVRGCSPSALPAVVGSGRSSCRWETRGQSSAPSHLGVEVRAHNMQDRQSVSGGAKGSHETGGLAEQRVSRGSHLNGAGMSWCRLPSHQRVLSYISDSLLLRRR